MIRGEEIGDAEINLIRERPRVANANADVIEVEIEKIPKLFFDEGDADGLAVVRIEIESALLPIGDSGISGFSAVGDSEYAVVRTANLDAVFLRGLRGDKRVELIAD